MSWFPLYATEKDFERIFDYLNHDNDIAFIVPNGSKSWIAKENSTFVDHSWYCLWHIPSGPLPLVAEELGTPPGIVEDPWAGWTEIRTGGRSDRPYFGDPPGVLWLEAHTASRATEGAIAMSGFSWVGNWFRQIGRPAKPTTERYWNRMRRNLKKGAHRIPRRGPVDGPDAEIWAMEEAFQQISDGRPRAINPG